MRIRITGRRLPKAALGLVGPPVCPEGQMPDPNNPDECIDDPNYIPPDVTIAVPNWRSTMGGADEMLPPEETTGEVAQEFYGNFKLDPPSVTATTSADEKPYDNFQNDFDLFKKLKYGTRDKAGNTIYNQYKDWFKKQYGDKGKSAVRKENAFNAFKKVNNFISPIDKGINEFKGAISNATLLANAINNKAYFTNDKSLNRFTNIYSQATSPIRLGNFDQEGNFDPRNIGAKSEGQFANPYYQKGTFPRLTAADGGELGNMMSYAAPIQSMTEIAPAPSSFGYFPRSSGQPTTSASTSSASANSGSTAGSSSQFIFPVENFNEGMITSHFGKRKSPKAGASSDHNGIDIGVGVDTPVLAPMDGTVENIYFDNNGGKQLIIRHTDGSKSGFAHLNNYNVSVGDQVTKGQKVALSGNTGNSTGPHLHFTFRTPNGERVDPFSYFSKMSGNDAPNLGVSNWNHNNPGNIHIGDFARGYNASKGRPDGGGHVAIFPDMTTGLKAMEDLLFGKNYINLTISQARRRWVGYPNNSEADIVRNMGGDRPLSSLSDEERKKLVSQFIKWEDRSVYEKLKAGKTIYKYGGTTNTENMKIRIVGVPGQKMAYGGQSSNSYSLDLGHRDVYAPMNKNAYESPSSTIGPVPRSQANIEAERGEEVYGDINQDGEVEKMTIGGERHTNGGTPLNVPEGSFIFSDTKKMKIKDEQLLKSLFSLPPIKGGYTPAEISKKYDINKYRAIVENPNTDVLAKKTAQRMMDTYKLKLGYLALVQEAMKGFPQGIPDIARIAMGTQIGQMLTASLREEEEAAQQAQQGAAPEEQQGQEMMMGEQPMSMEQMPEEQMMGQMEPQQMMERFGGIAHFENGGYIPEEYGMMAYGGYVPDYDPQFEFGGGYEDAKKIQVNEKNGVKMVKYPDGTTLVIYPNNRVQEISPSGAKKMRELRPDDVVGVKQGNTTQGTDVSVILGNGSSRAYFPGNRVIEFTEDHNVSKRGNYTPGSGISWEGSAPATTSSSTAGTSATSTANDPYPNFTIWGGDKHSGKKNASTYSKEQWVDKLKALGYGKDPSHNWTNKSIQQFLYGIPAAKTKIDELHTKHGRPIGGSPSEGLFDEKLGIRWQDALDAATPPPTTDTPPVTTTPPSTTGTPPPAGSPLYACVNGKVEGPIPPDKVVAGTTYYASSEEAEKACKPGEPDKGITPPNEYVPNKSNIPFGYTKQDLNTKATTRAQQALIEPYYAPRTAITPELPRVAYVDPRQQIAARQAVYNSMANQLGVFGPSSGYLANKSLIAGRTMEGAAQDAAQAKTTNVGIFNKAQGDISNAMNQVNMWNAEQRAKSIREQNENDAAFRAAYSLGLGRINAADNQADTNAAMLYNLSLTESPYYYYNPYMQTVRFNDAEGEAAYWRSIQNPGTQDSDGSKYAQFQKIMRENPGIDAETARKIAYSSSSGGYQTETEYPSNPSKNKKVKKVPVTTQKYGGYIMNNPFF